MTSSEDSPAHFLYCPECRQNTWFVDGKCVCMFHPTWADQIAGWVLVAGALAVLFLGVALVIWLVASIIGVI